MAREQVERELGRPPQLRLQDRPRNLAEQLDIAERRPAAAVVEIEVVEADRLLVDRIVAPERIDVRPLAVISLMETSRPAAQYR